MARAIKYRVYYKQAGLESYLYVYAKDVSNALKMARNRLGRYASILDVTRSKKSSMAFSKSYKKSMKRTKYSKDYY